MVNACSFACLKHIAVTIAVAVAAAAAIPHAIQYHWQCEGGRHCVVSLSILYLAINSRNYEGETQQNERKQTIRRRDNRQVIYGLFITALIELERLIIEKE